MTRDERYTKILGYEINPENDLEWQAAQAWANGAGDAEINAILNGEEYQPEPEPEQKKGSKPLPNRTETKPEPIAKVVPIPDIVKKTPVFPKDEAFQGAFSHYWQAYGDKNEVCPSYHFASALAQISTALGKSYYIKSKVGKHYPNWYQALIGTSYIAAKSKVLDDTSEAIQNIFEVDEDASSIYRQTGSLGSAEALKESFATRDDKGNSLEWYDGKHGIRYFAHIDELRYLFVKAKQTATEGLTPELTKIYKCPRQLRVQTRNKPVIADYPVLNLMGCTTLEWFEESISLSDIAGGFINRFVFYLHEQQPLFPFMEDINITAEQHWQNVLYRLGRESIKSDRIFDLDDDVAESYKEFYIQSKQRVIDNPTEIETIAGARIVEHTLKLALVFSTLENGTEDNLIHPPAWDAAVAVSKYWAEVTKTLFQNIAIDKLDKLEQTILSKLAELNNDSTWTNLRKKMSGRTNTTDFNRAIENLLIAEFIAVTDNRPKRIIRIN